MNKMTQYVIGLCLALLLWPWQAAQAGWVMTTTGQAGFNTPTAYANLRTVDFSTVTLAAEQTATRLSYSSSLASGASIKYNDTSTGLTGFAGNSVELASGTSGTSSLTINFPNGGTSYVAFLWGLSVKDENSQYVTYTFSDSTTVTLYNCQSTSNASCVGTYVPSNWLLDFLNNLLSFILGGNSYDSAYLTYTPASGVTITKVQFFNSRCDGCGFLGSNASQNFDIDNLSYVDPLVGPHHVEITAPSATATAGTPVTFTVKSCSDAACTLYTTGLSGTLGITGAGTVSYPGTSTYTIGARSSSTTIQASMGSGGTATVALSAPSRTITGSPAVYCGMGVAAASGNACTLTVLGLHHLELTTAAASAAAGVSVTYTIKACADAACSTLYTGGVTGTLSISGVVATYSPAAAFTITAGTSSTTVNASMTFGTATASISSPSPTPAASLYCGMGVAAASGNSCALTVSLGLHHVEVTTSASSGVTCNPITYTLKACVDAACTSVYTGGVAGTLTVSGTGVTVNPSSQVFAIPASGTVTANAHATTAGTVTAALSLVLPVPLGSPPVYCGMGTAAISGGSCNFTTNTSALLFDVPNHYSDVAQSVTVTAVKASDNGAVCTPGFASVSKSVLFKCTYTNPSTGTKPVIVGGSALNASNSAGAACDGTGRSVSLAFNASGVATTTFQYADVGQLGLTANYTGSGSDAGLLMSGNDSFIAAPYSLSVTGVPAGTLRAGNSFAATVTATNYSGGATPNFSRETVPEGATLSFVKVKPIAVASSNGVLSGALGSFSAGVATTSNLSWNEVGSGHLAARLTSGSYLGSGLVAAGSTASAITPVAENGTVVLPTGSTATITYGANGLVKRLAGQSGSVACTNGVFGDPNPGVGKTCSYVLTAGPAPGTATSVGPFIPHHFDISNTQSCGTFTYSGAPVTVSIWARNAAGVTTVNYHDAYNDTVAGDYYARDVTISTPTNGSTGSLSTTLVTSSNFSAGAASLSDTFTFTNKLTGPATVGLRAAVTYPSSDIVTSSGYTEGSLPLRSGRLTFSNAFASERTILAIPVQAQYWSGKAWILNSLDGCSVVPVSAVSRSGYLDNKGASTAAWTTTVTPLPSTTTAVQISGGSGTLTLGAPSPTATGSVDIAFNLGATAADNACLSTHAATTGAGLSWLRSRNGNCAATYDRDPSARISFGVFSPETQRTVHTRDLF